MKNLFIVLCVVIAAYYGWNRMYGPAQTPAELSAAQIQTLAASVKAEEVVVYTTTECPHCQAAKQWLGQNGFAFTECNMSVQRDCEDEFKAFGADGTPFLVIRRAGKEHHMRDGFDSREFLAAL